MASDIARTIGQGTDRTSQNIAQVQSQAESFRADQRAEKDSAMQQEMVKAEMQNNVDTKTKSLMMVGDHYQSKVSTTKKQVQDAVDMAAAGKPISESDMSKLQTAHQNATNERNQYLQSVTASPQMMSALTSSSFANEDIYNRLFTDYFETMSPEDQNKEMAKWTAIVRAEQEMAGAESERKMGQALSFAGAKAGAEESSRLMARSQFQDPNDVPTPTSEAMGLGQYKISLQDQDVAPADAKKWYESDLAYFKPRLNEIEEIDQGERLTWQKIMQSWKPPQKGGKKAAEAAGNYVEYLDDLDLPEDVSNITLDLLASLRTAAQSGDSRRIGAFVNGINDFVQPATPALRPVYPGVNSEGQ